MCFPICITRNNQEENDNARSSTASPGADAQPYAHANPAYAGRWWSAPEWRQGVMLWIVPALAGIGCVLAVWRARCPSGRALAWSLSGMAVIANAGWYYNAMWLLPIIDLVAGCIALRFRAEGEWVALFIHAIKVRLILHVLDALTGHTFFVAYIHALNATFAWMLMVVVVGGSNGPCDNRIRNLLRRLRSLGRSPAHSFRGLNRGC